MTTIRYCTREDFGPVFGLLRQLWPDMELDRGALENMYHGNLGCDSQRYFCAVNAGEVVGFCALSTRRSLFGPSTLAYVDELVVEESRRGQGIGGMLLDRAREIALEAGCSRLELDSAIHRERAHRFYEKRGLKLTGMLFRWEL
ncbi:MAG: GNAT family N-acetyltransferase [Actinomycetota bacterium]|nr:GNAT family N-acetyltransferase [Actinomycetota bacterium]MDD5666241.1 GNAT family N-acetyltransferase [Actinomycetota bacterium]